MLARTSTRPRSGLSRTRKMSPCLAAGSGRPSARQSTRATPSVPEPPSDTVRRNPPPTAAPSPVPPSRRAYARGTTRNVRLTPWAL